MNRQINFASSTANSVQILKYTAHNLSPVAKYRLIQYLLRYKKPSIRKNGCETQNNDIKDPYANTLVPEKRFYTYDVRIHKPTQNNGKLALRDGTRYPN